MPSPREEAQVFVLMHGSAGIDVQILGKLGCVAYVLPCSWAASRGIQAGDVVSAVNGIAVSSLDAWDFDCQMQRRPLRLSILATRLKGDSVEAASCSSPLGSPPPPFRELVSSPLAGGLSSARRPFSPLRLLTPAPLQFSARALSPPAGGSARSVPLLRTPDVFRAPRNRAGNDALCASAGVHRSMVDLTSTPLPSARLPARVPRSMSPLRLQRPPVPAGSFSAAVSTASSSSFAPEVPHVSALCLSRLHSAEKVCERSASVPQFTVKIPESNAGKKVVMPKIAAGLFDALGDLPKTDSQDFRSLASARHRSKSPLHSTRRHHGQDCLCAQPDVGSLVPPLLAAGVGAVAVMPPPPAVAGLAASAASIRGVKASAPDCPNQDTHLVMDFGSGRVLAAVFDGHGAMGHQASRHACKTLEQQVPALSVLPFHDLREALTAFFESAHAAIVGEGFSKLSGTTATVAVIDGVAGHALVAHVGDSQMSVSVGSEVAFVTPEHRISGADAERVSQQGGEIIVQGNTARLYVRGKSFPGIAIARSLGDSEANAVGLLSTPEFHEVALGPGCNVVVASDGVWDVVPPAETAELLASRRDLAGGHVERLATSLVEEARHRWAALDGAHIDDITAIVVQAVDGTDRNAGELGP